jgi:SAM-dependent methyltransferase
LFVNKDWRSYDAIAETYARVADRCFAKPAGDLVSSLDLKSGSRVLDVGTGTGVVASLAAEIVGPAGVVVGLDPAIEMVRGLERRCNAHPVVGELPRLPHPDGSFDAVAAAFVLTHVDDHASALTAMVKTLRPNGRLAISSWAQGESVSPPGKTWQAVAMEFVRDEDLQSALRGALPSQNRFSDPALLDAALAAAGLVRILVREVTHSIEMPVSAFAELRLISLSGRFIASVLPDREWIRFKEEASRRLAATYGSRICFEQRANIAVGSKAG